MIREQFHHNAALLNAAIDSLLKRLPALPVEIHPLVRDQVAYLMKEQKLLYASHMTVQPTPEPTPQIPIVKPWYPDGSDQWVETFGNKPILAPDLMIERLAALERTTHSYRQKALRAGECLGWPQFVAYKVVK